MSEIAKKPTRKPRCRGRVRNVEVLEGLYTFTMRAPKGEEPGGVYIRQRNRRKVTRLGFDYLAFGAGTTIQIEGREIKLGLHPEGVSVMEGKISRLIQYKHLLNFIKPQPELFA